MTLLRLLPLLVFALFAVAAPAHAAQQTPKNGCLSETIPNEYGYLTSPEYANSSSTQVTFHAWWEIESIIPSQDDFGVEVTSDGGETWTPLEASNFAPPPSDPEAQPDLPHSNNGFNQAPGFAPFGANLPPMKSPQTQQIRFKFKPLDHQYNGFRGLAVDNVAVSGTSLDESFEEGAPGWSFSGYWHVKANPQQQSVLSPAINPDLVTLPDSGNLPATQFGSRVAWYGEDETGTFCGKDFAFTPAPPPPPPPPPPTLLATPSFVQRPIDSTHTVRLTLTNDDGTPTAGQTLRWSVAGANPQPAAEAVTGSDGAADVSWTGPEAGNDTLQAYHDSNGDDTQNPDEAVAGAAVDWRAPVAGQSVNVAVERGVVFVKFPGGASLRPDAGAAQTPGFVQITQPMQIPVGSVVNTKRGTVGMTSARNLRGATQKGSFSGGRFKVRQKASRAPVTEMKMTGGSFRSCRRNVGRRSSVGAARARTAARRIRRLRGNARGRFRTRGRNSSATVRGTNWTMTDQCNGTLTRVRSGVVRVRDFSKKRTVTLRRGKRYLARPKRR